MYIRCHHIVSSPLIFHPAEKGRGFYRKGGFHFKKSILLTDLQGLGFDSLWIPTFRTGKHFGLQPLRNAISYTEYLYVKYSCSTGSLLGLNWESIRE